jgi:hypothetical protein
MSIKLDAVAYRNRSDYRLRRLEEMILLLHTVVTKTFHGNELQEIYNRHIEEIRGEINASENNQDQPIY